MRVFETITINNFLKHTIINKGTKFVDKKQGILDWPRPREITENGYQVIDLTNLI